METKNQKPQSRISALTTKLAVGFTAVSASAITLAAESNTITLPAEVAIAGLATVAGGIFAIKASPSLMMWGYRKALGFIGR